MNAPVTRKGLYIPFMRSVFVSVFFLLASMSLFGQATPQDQPKDAVVRVPFVGCESDGQVGPVKAPTGELKEVEIPADAAQRLAFYRSKYGLGTLAPRGWHCFGTYGSHGLTLYISPEPIKADDILSPNWKGFSGPGIQLSELSGDTSGRFAVARIVARVFPERSQFVQQVIHEGFEPESAFPTGPYPNDKMTQRGSNIVEFQTPANTEGLGTHSRLLRNDTPINGVVILYGNEPNLLQLSVRTSGQDGELATAIIEQIVRDTVRLRDTTSK